MFKKVIDGKPVIIKSSSNNIPSFETIKQVYRKIPDNKNIPIVFETKKQYLKEYIRNQEIKRNVDFTPAQEKAYISRELKDMNNVVSRYTTKKNPYIDLRTVFFTDKKITPKQFEASAYHEYAHEAWENNPRIRKDWQAVNKATAPTPYGRTNSQEDFAESYMLYKMGKLKDPKRKAIIKDISLNMRFDAPIKARYPGRKGFAIKWYPTADVLKRHQEIDGPEYDITNPANQIGNRLSNATEFIKEKKFMTEDWPGGGIGGFQPTLVNHKGSIIDGRHRLLALKNLGYTEIPVEEFQDNMDRKIFKDKDLKLDNISKNYWKRPSYVTENKGYRIVNIPTNRLYYMRARGNLPGNKLIVMGEEIPNKNALIKSAQKYKELEESHGTKIALSKPKTKYLPFVGRKTVIEAHKHVEPWRLKLHMEDIMQPSNFTDLVHDKSYDDPKAYVNELSKALMSAENSVPMLDLSETNLSEESIGEGRHRILAAKQAGYKYIPVIVEDTPETDKLLREKKYEYTPKQSYPEATDILANIDKDLFVKDKRLADTNIFTRYHGTSTKYLPRILKEGLLPAEKTGVQTMKDIERYGDVERAKRLGETDTHLVSVTSRPTYAAAYADRAILNDWGSEPVILKLRNIPKKVGDTGRGWYPGQDEFKIEHVPPENISILSKGKDEIELLKEKRLDRDWNKDLTPDNYNYRDKKHYQHLIDKNIEEGLTNLDKPWMNKELIERDPGKNALYNFNKNKSDKNKNVYDSPSGSQIVMDKGRGISPDYFPSVDDISYFYDNAPIEYSPHIIRLRSRPRDVSPGIWATYEDFGGKGNQVSIYPRKIGGKNINAIKQILIHETGHKIDRDKELLNKYINSFNPKNSPSTYTISKLRLKNIYPEDKLMSAAKEDIAESFAMWHPGIRSPWVNILSAKKVRKQALISEPPLSDWRKKLEDIKIKQDIKEQSMKERAEFLNYNLGKGFKKGMTPREEYEIMNSPEALVEEALFVEEQGGFKKSDEEYQKDYDKIKKIKSEKGGTYTMDDFDVNNDGKINDKDIDIIKKYWN